jgi:DNA-binding FadR family transcriptional regulator
MVEESRQDLAPDETGTADTPDLPKSVAAGSSAIAERLLTAILDGTYPDGTRLPPERELARHFGASRGTVREALRQLETKGLLTRRIGSGTFVDHSPGPDGDTIAQATSPIELIDVRLAIEPQIVRLAAINASAQDLDRVGEALRRLEAVGDDREAFSEADETFHLLLAECTRNPLMVWLYQHVNEVRGHAQWGHMKNKILTTGRIGDYNAQHRRIYEALRSRDVEAAVATMTAHLEKAREDLLGVRHV